MKVSSAKKIDKYQYNLHDILGQGSFGTVYLGKDTENGEFRAIKVINTSSMNKEKDHALMMSLLNEIKILRSLDNPNIIKCYDVLTTPNNTYIVMDYCDGGDLKSFLKKHMRLSEDRALSILKQVLNGYMELFKNGIIHRDLKAENILIKNGVFKIGDFGFAKVLRNFEKDVLKSLVGTPLYMSPQILKQDEYTSKSDIWSIGIIFFEMVVGKTPWSSVSDTDLLKRMLSEQVEIPAGIEISELSRRFIMGCLQREEGDRLGWTQVYSHELFEDCFNYRRRMTIFEAKVGKIGARLGKIAKSKNIDINKLFNSIDHNKNGKLELDELARLLRKIDENLTREQIEYIFNRVDTDNSNFIDFDEFERWLNTEEEPQSENNLKNPKKNDNFQSSLANLRFCLKGKQEIVEETMENLLKNGKKSFSEEEFFVFIKKIDWQIPHLDISEVFWRLCDKERAVAIETLRKTLGQERFFKHRASESHSPAMTEVEFRHQEISKTHSSETLGSLEKTMKVLPPHSKFKAAKYMEKNGSSLDNKIYYV